jgi:hypothetical protein
MSIKIISCHPVFNENALVLSQKYQWSLEKDFDPQPNDLYIVFGAHELSHQLLEVQYRKNSSFGYIILNSEQIHSQFFKNKFYLQLMKRNVVCDYNAITPDWLKENDIKVFSYFYFEFMKFNLDTPREYDVVFVGTPNEKRTALYEKLKDKYNVFFDFEWKHAASDTLTTLYHKAKVVINMPYYDQNALETHRINKALACGCSVVSLKSSDEDANQFYDDYVYFCDDIEEGLEKYFKGLPPKKSYEELIKALSQKVAPHFLFVIQQVHRKLISLSNIDGTTTETVCQQTTTSANIPTNTETKVCA